MVAVDARSWLLWTTISRIQALDGPRDHGMTMVITTMGEDLDRHQQQLVHLGGT